MEVISGVVTGSEFTTRIPFPLQLQGLIGEYVVDDEVFVVKCHYPLRFGPLDYSVNKILSCVRSPFNVIRSNFEFFQGCSHQIQFENDLPKEDPETWDKIVRHHVKEIKNYFDHLVQKMEAGFPMYFTRFEELISHPRPELIGVF